MQCTALHFFKPHCSVFDFQVHCTHMSHPIWLITALHYTVMHCTALHFTRLYLSVLQCSAVYLITLHTCVPSSPRQPYTQLHYFTVMSCNVLHCINILYCTLYLTETYFRVLYFTILNFNVLFCITCIISFLTMEYWNRTLHYFLGRGVYFTVHSLGSIRTHCPWD